MLLDNQEFLILFDIGVYQGIRRYMTAYWCTCGYVKVYAGLCKYRGVYVGTCGHMRVYEGTFRAIE